MIYLFICQAAAVTAYDVNDNLSLEIQLAGAYQHQDISGAEDTGRGAVPLQAGIRLRPTPVDELYLEFGFAAGNGLNDGTSPFLLAPWGATLEDDVKNINGRKRNYLLNAWYRHLFQFAEGHHLALTGGIVDATDYLDQNAYANDEYTQFMNAALVNAPSGITPSYDYGAASEWVYRHLALHGIVMNVGENRDGNSYTFYGVQAGYTIDTPLGSGTYRLIYQGTSNDFLDPAGTSQKARHAVNVSCDQQLGEVLGAWLRIGYQEELAAIDFKQKYSGGLDLSGKVWGRDGDNLGIGYAYLVGGNRQIEHSRVLEGYLRFVLNRFFAATLDLQHLNDRFKAGDDFSGFILGIRLVANF